MAYIDFKELVSACVDLAEQAGTLIREVHSSGDLQVQIKGYTVTGVEDPLTQADTKSQLIIVDGLLSRWPTLKIVAEEDREDVHQVPQPRIDKLGDILLPDDLQNVLLSDIAVYVDPLDATREFTKGHVECVMTLIGITVKGQPKAGVMYQPFVGQKGTMIYGVVGAGVYGLERVGKHEGVIVATTASHATPAVEDAINNIAPSKVLRVGGAGYKALLLLEGKADAYVFPIPGCKLWDTCAPHALILASGGIMTDGTGGEIIYNPAGNVNVTKGVLAALHDHAKFAKLINS